MVISKTIKNQVVWDKMGEVEQFKPNQLLSTLKEFEHTNLSFIKILLY